MAKPKHLKKPVIAEYIESSKKPSITERPTNNDARPTWRIFLLQMRDPFGWHILERDKVHFILTKLQEYEGQTWNEILVKDKKKNHSICSLIVNPLVLSMRLTHNEVVQAWREQSR